METRIARALEQYDAQGWHRTGTPVDAASAAWFVETVREIGAAAALEEFAIDRVDPLVATVETQGRRIVGLPIFDALDLPDGTVRGALGPVGSGSPIGVIVLRSPAPDADFDALRREAGHRALVAVTVGPAPGLQARNAGAFADPFGVPVLQVGSEHESFLLAAAETGADATLSISTRRVPAQSANVVAHVAGRDPSLAPVVVSTPRTGWWNCAGERGGGIACWLELLRSAQEEPHQRDAIFVTFGGHELDFLGVQAFLERRPAMATDAHVWVHFGANIGAVEGAAIRVAASNAGDLAQARSALAAHSAGAVTSPEPGVVIGGESVVVAKLGARCVALLGGNDLFHFESDRWPRNNDVAQIARQASAFVALLRELANGSS